MGAIFETRRFEAMSTEKLKQEFSELQSRLLDQYGSDAYAGHLGIANGLHITSMQFKANQLKEADQWLCDHAQKWEAAEAVKVGDFTKSWYTKASTIKMIADVDKLTLELENFELDILKKAKAAKSKMRACKCCGSKINVSKIPDVHPTNGWDISSSRALGRTQLGRLTPKSFTDCPVCFGNLLLTATDEARRKRLQERLMDARKKLQDAKTKVNWDKEPYWLVGAWCAQ